MNGFTTGKPFFDNKLLEICIGRGLGALNGLTVSECGVCVVQLLPFRFKNTGENTLHLPGVPGCLLGVTDSGTDSGIVNLFRRLLRLKLLKGLS